MYTYGYNTHKDWVGEGATAREVMIVICTDLKMIFLDQLTHISYIIPKHTWYTILSSTQVLQSP